MKKILVIILAVFCFYTNFFQTVSSDDGNELFKITFIDVGKGDCILVQTGENTVMIDTGYKETAKSVSKYLQDHEITKIDAMIISHYHKDHVGGAASLIKSGIPITTIYMPDYEGTRTVYEEMLEELKKHTEIETVRLTEQQSFTLGEAAYTLYPSAIAFDGDNDNDVSMAAVVRYKDRSAFFAGDLEDPGIDSLLNYADQNNISLECDILKLPHHGAQGEYTEKLINRVKPQSVIITDGGNKRADGTLTDLLATKQIPVHCSAEEGTIIVTGTESSSYRYDKSNQTKIYTGDPWHYILLEDGSATIAGYNGNETEITIPAVIEGFPVSSIADSAFYNNKTITGVRIPDSVVSIGDSAFSWCISLKAVDIPDSVRSVGDGAFMRCEALEDITLPDSVTEIGISAFERCTNLKRITISANLTAIPESMFERCRSLETITIPQGVTSIGEDAFKKCDSLKHVEIPDSVTLIDEEAFINCINLESIVLPENLKNIKKKAFAKCSSLKSVWIPKTVQSIKASVFSECSQLTDIWYEGSEEQWNAIDRKKSWDEGTPSDKVIHYNSTVPDGPDQPDVPVDTDDPDEQHDSESRFFRMPKLPKTGFSAVRPEALPYRTADAAFQTTGLTLQIPVLDVSAEIVTIPFLKGEDPVEMLGSRAGMPEEFAAPGKGLCILAGHNHLNTTEAGPFALLSQLQAGDRIFVLKRGREPLSFSVYAAEKITADDFGRLAEISKMYADSLTLVTCEDELSEGGYASRRIVSARPIRE